MSYKYMTLERWAIPDYFFDPLYRKLGVLVIEPDERMVEKWFLENYKRLGFVEIRKTREGRADPGDYLGLTTDGRWVRIELETTTSGFFLHDKDIRDRIEIIVCFRRTKPRAKWKQEELARKTIIAIEDFYDVDPFLLTPLELAERLPIYEVAARELLRREIMHRKIRRAGL